MNDIEAKARVDQMIRFVEQEAKEKANEIESKTEQEYNLAKSKYLHQAKEKIEAEYEKKWKSLDVKKRIAHSTVINNARMDIMRAKNDCVNSLIKDAKIEVANRLAADSSKNKKLLHGLILEGLIKLIETEVTVLCRQVDLSIVEELVDSVASEYAEIMTRETGRSHSVKIRVDKSKFLPAAPQADSNLPSCCGGVVLVCNNGQIRCNNTVDDRLKLISTNCLPLLINMLFS